MRKIMIILGFMILIGLMGINQVHAEYPSSDFGDHPDYTYYINGYTTNGTFDYYYGMAEEKESGEVEGLLVIKNTDSDTLFRTVMFDEGYRENIRYLAFFKNETMGVVITKFGINPETITFELKYTEVLLYDLFGNYLDRIVFEEAMTTCASHGDLLILSKDMNYTADYVIDETLTLVILPSVIEATGTFQYPYEGEATINGESVESIDITEPGIYAIEITRWRYHYAFMVTLHPTIEGITHEGVYTGTVSIVSKGILRIDDEPYVNASLYDLVGYHTLTVEGINGYLCSFAFTLKPFITGIQEGGVYTGGLYIRIEGASLFLNDAPYTPSSLIARPGRYELSIRGSNDYQDTLHFVINPSITNLSNGDVVHSPYILNFIGEAVLNGEVIEPGTTLTEPGDYTLQLLFEEEVFQTLHFQIVSETPSSFWHNLKIPYLELGLGILSLIGLYIIIRKK